MENNPDRLSAGDAAFLHLERECIPLSVGAVCHFDGKIDFEKFIPYVESKLPLLPRYKQRVMAPPLGIGVMMWIPDDQFDIRNHVREIKLKRGTESELQAHVDDIISKVLDRRRPLWDLTLFTGLKAGRSALLARVHHCLADGVSGVGILQAIMDASPAIPKLPKQKPEPPPSLPDQATRLLDHMTTSWFSAVEGVLSAESELLKFAQQLTGKAMPSYLGINGNGTSSTTGSNGTGDSQLKLDKLGELLPDFIVPTDRLPFNKICNGPQKFVWGEVSLPRIKAIKNACGTTVNDVVLTLVAMVVKKYALLHEAPVAHRKVRIIIPVNVRNGENTPNLGNRITFVPMTLPIGSKSPADLMSAVHQRTQVIKTLHLGELVMFAGTVLGTLPTSVQIALGQLLSQLPLNMWNLICTNVPGPQMPLYVLGRKMLTCYPRVPIGGEMGMNVAAITYNGVAYFGYTCDAKAVPDTEVLPRLLTESFEELESAVLGPAKRVAKKRAVRAPRKQKPKIVAEPLVTSERIAVALEQSSSASKGEMSEHEQEKAMKIGA